MKSIIFKSSVLVLTAFIFVSCKPQVGTPTVEQFAEVDTWVSSLWGMNAPKIVEDKSGNVVVMVLSGAYPDATSTPHMRAPDGTWTKGSPIAGTYQPSLVLLDEEDRVNIITNSQTEPERHFRAKQAGDITQLELIASGNGQADGRGWYVGAAIHGSTIYQAYITLDYDFWFTWKELTDSVWAEPVLVYDGYADPGGNFALLYPNFYFKDNTGYFITSHSSDGSTYNFKDKVFISQFDIANPAVVTTTPVYEGHRGYGAFGFNLVIDDEYLYCAFVAGVYYYGDQDSTVLAPGSYLARTPIGQDSWEYFPIGSSGSAILLQADPIGGLTAIIRSQVGEYRQIVIMSTPDHGETWINETTISASEYPVMAGAHSFQLPSAAGGSVPSLTIFYSCPSKTKGENNLYHYRLGLIQAAYN